MNQKGSANVLVMGVIVILLGVGGYYVWKMEVKKSDTATSTESPRQDVAPKNLSAEQINLETRKDGAKMAEVSASRSKLEIYFDKYKKYPTSFRDLFRGGVLGIGNPNPLWESDILYAVNPERTRYHIGVRIMAPEASVTTQSSLSKDHDYNSLEQGWQNGFSGQDPIYDFWY